MIGNRQRMYVAATLGLALNGAVLIAVWAGRQWAHDWDCSRLCGRVGVVVGVGSFHCSERARAGDDAPRNCALLGSIGGGYNPACGFLGRYCTFRARHRTLIRGSFRQIWCTRVDQAAILRDV